jgi:GNAT superfamily N-acetyltransferase
VKADAGAHSPLLHALQRAGGEGIVLREEGEGDREFLAGLYADMRAEELAPVQWPEDAKLAFLREQFELQRSHYRQHYAGAEFLVIQAQGQPIGRLYARRGGTEIRLMDIVLLRTWRGRGIGARLIGALIEFADRHGEEISLHVEPENPVRRYYERCGFVFEEDRGAYHFMRRVSQAQLNTAS